MTFEERGRTVAVLGLGLIGGSMARDFAALGMRVLGHDADEETLDAARAGGIVHECLDASLAGAGEASVVVLAVPVSATQCVMSVVATHVTRAGLVMDVGSTKRSAIAAAESFGGEIAERFVGSHPMAGDHRSGWIASRRGLFAGATVYLCSTKSTGRDALALARELWTALGARPELIDADTHDDRVAFTSHLPHVASAAIATALSKAGVTRGDLGPGGRDVVRIAASSPETWTAIAMDNADAILRATAKLDSELARFRAALEARDANALHQLFSVAREWAGDGGSPALPAP
jgi:prephenate dehydrogenase